MCWSDNPRDPTDLGEYQRDCNDCRTRGARHPESRGRPADARPGPTTPASSTAGHPGSSVFSGRPSGLPTCGKEMTSVIEELQSTNHGDPGAARRGYRGRSAIRGCAAPRTLEGPHRHGCPSWRRRPCLGGSNPAARLTAAHPAGGCLADASLASTRKRPRHRTRCTDRGARAARRTSRRPFRFDDALLAGRC